MPSAALQFPDNGTFCDYVRLPDKVHHDYAKLLKLYSIDNFYSLTWHIHLSMANRTGKVLFPQSQTLLESDITRITVINMLTSGTAIATCQRCLPISPSRIMKRQTIGTRLPKGWG